MGQIDAVLEQLRSTLGDDAEVRDVSAAVSAMARAFRQASADNTALSGSAVARMLGISRQAVNQRAGRGSLLAVADSEGVRYPLWQFRDGSSVRGLLALVRGARAAGVDDSALAAWIAADQDRIDAVAAGRAKTLIDVVAEARRPRTTLKRHRVSGRAPRLSDGPAGD
jgi:hypothetical protein